MHGQQNIKIFYVYSFLESFVIRNVQDSKEEPNKFVRAARHILWYMQGGGEQAPRVEFVFSILVAALEWNGVDETWLLENERGWGKLDMHKQDLWQILRFIKITI